MKHLDNLSRSEMPWRFEHIPPSGGDMRFKAIPDGGGKSQNDLLLYLGYAKDKVAWFKRLNDCRIQVSLDGEQNFMLELAP